MKKTFRFSEEETHNLEIIMKNYGMATQNEAVCYVITQHTGLVKNLQQTNQALFQAESELEELKSTMHEVWAMKQKLRRLIGADEEE